MSIGSRQLYAAFTVRILHYARSNQTPYEWEATQL